MTTKKNPIARRRLLGALALGGAATSTGNGQERPASADGLASVVAAHGSGISEERLRKIKPAVERRLGHLEAIRRMDIDDSVEPAPFFVPTRFGASRG